MIPRIVPTPIAPLTLPTQPLEPRRVAPEVLASTLPGPGRDKLADGAVLAVTTGQQPGLFTGPLYTIYKALSVIALAQRLERELGAPVVPVFWVAGDDHDFAEANHTTFLNAQGDLADIVLRERPADAPLAPLARERCGVEIRGALDQLKSGTPDTEFKADVVRWLESAYRPDVTLADACAEALQALLAPRGLAVLRAHDRGAKQAAAPRPSGCISSIARCAGSARPCRTATRRCSSRPARGGTGCRRAATHSSRVAAGNDSHARTSSASRERLQNASRPTCCCDP